MQNRRRLNFTISQDFAGELDSSEQNTGFYIDSKSFGLETFAGTEISMYIYAQDVGADRDSCSLLDRADN